MKSHNYELFQYVYPSNHYLEKKILHFFFLFIHAWFSKGVFHCRAFSLDDDLRQRTKHLNMLNHNSAFDSSSWDESSIGVWICGGGSACTWGSSIFSPRIWAVKRLASKSRSGHSVTILLAPYKKTRLWMKETKDRVLVVFENWYLKFKRILKSW